MDLKSYIKLNKIEVAKFAKTIGRSRQTIYNWFNGDSSPSISKAEEIERVTGGSVTLDDFRKEQA